MQYIHKIFVLTHKQLITREHHFFSLHSFCSILVVMKTIKKTCYCSFHMSYCLCEKSDNFSVPYNRDMAYCLYLYLEMINYDFSNSIVLHFPCRHRGYYHFLLRNLNLECHISGTAWQINHSLSHWGLFVMIFIIHYPSVYKA